MMSLSSIKLEILETMLANTKPMKAAEIAAEIKQDPKPVNMHLLGLIRMKYASTPEKGKFSITEKGKAALGLPEITKEKAEAILAYAPHDKSFNFYLKVGEPLHLHAHNLRDFAVKIQKADISSIEFHMSRGDFEEWFRGLGDVELAKKTGALKGKKAGEELRNQLHEMVWQRYQELARLAGQEIPQE